MSMPRLGQLRTLKATEVWGNEPQVFTPWLAANLALLAEALQLGELELRGTEVPAGDFRLDILAEDTTGSPVIIENQFGATDHRHLGQLISYAASQGSRCTIVWIAERFKEDHRAAIDWLNANTGEELSFFGVEIEALVIGESDPAPYFNLVAKPNAWAKSVGAASRESASAEDASRHRLRLAYWASFREFLALKKSTFTIRRENRDHWFEFPIGRAGVVISATINTRPQRAGVELYINKDAAKTAIRSLEAQRGDIELEIGESLDFQELPGKKASRIALYRHDLDPGDPNAFPELHRWMLDAMDRFRRGFASRVGQLVLTERVASVPNAPDRET